MRRTTFLSSAVALSACPSVLRAQSLPKLRVGGTSSIDIIGTLYGIHSGMFANAGLDVEFVYMTSGASVLAALIGGSLEIGKVALFNILLAHSKGVPIVIEAPAEIYRSATPDTAMVVAKASHYHTAADLNGTTLAVPALGDTFTIANMAWVDAHGGDSRTLKFVELPNRASIDAIASGRVSAATLTVPTLADAIDNGPCRILGYTMDVFGREYISTAYVCSASFAAQNAAVLARFRKTLSEAASYANAHRDAMIPIIAETFKFDPKTVAAMPASIAGTAAQLHDPRMFQTMIDQAAKYNVIARSFPYTELIDPNALT